VIPPWLIIGAVVILVPVFIFMTIENINRQKKQTTRLLVGKGAALIRSFEAGLHWGGFQLQKLLMETAEQPDIDYLTVNRHLGEQSWPTATPLDIILHTSFFSSESSMAAECSKPLVRRTRLRCSG
jgi:hypothetical protein